MSQTPHAPYLVVSIFTLRRWWQGPVTIYAWPESLEIARRIASDFNADADEWCPDPEYRGKNGQFEKKVLLMQSLSEGTNLYLDSDTAINGRLDAMFEAAERHGFAASQFSHWTTKNRIIQPRIKRLRNYPEIDQTLVEDVINNVWPSVNGGVFACKPDSPVLPLWHKWTVLVREIFISDETVLHSLQPRFVPTGEMTVVRGGRYNYSTVYPPPGMDERDVVVFHYHGDSNVRFSKSPRGCELWWPLYQFCMRENIGGLRDWRKDIQRNKHLEALERAIDERGFEAVIAEAKEAGKKRRQPEEAAK